MANPLTGGFEAVVQVAIRQIDGLLATLHQNGATSETALKLMHSVQTRVGDARRRPPGVDAFRDWVFEYQSDQPPGPKPPLHDLLATTTPPGVAKLISSAFADLDLVLDPDPPDLIRGTASVQLSTLRIQVDEGSTSEVTVVAGIRALYKPDDGTTPLPEAIHGTVRATYGISKLTTGPNARLLIRPSSQDQKIEFIAASGSGLTTQDVSRISGAIRTFLRDGIEMPPIDLPQGFPFADFKGVGSGVNTAVALPVQLSGNPAPAGGIQGITNSLVDNSGFAFAVSREHVQNLVDVEAIRDAISERPIVLHVSVWGFSGTVTYGLRFSSGPTLSFKPGAIEISGRIEAKTETFWAPNGWVQFTQRLALNLNPSTQQVSLVELGDPDVDESWFIPHSRAVNVVKSEIANALVANGPAIREIFSDARSTLVSALRTFEQSASATYTQVEITPDGVVIRGDVSSASRTAPVVQIGETNQGQLFTALESWIPGGQIDRFDWTWVEYPHNAVTPFGGVAKSATETATFVLPKPPGVNQISRICLRLVGSRILPNGQSESVAAGTTCDIEEPVLTMDAPSWWGPLMIPVWKPNLAADAILVDAVSAHISVQSDHPQRRSSRNVLVFFPDWQNDAPLETLSKALGAARRQQIAPDLLVVVPAGAFVLTRREFEARLTPLSARQIARIQVAEDTEGGWARSFGVDQTPSLFLVNPRRQFVWQAGGRLDPAEIATALDKHLMPTGVQRFRPVRGRADVGEPAPDFYFKDDGGNEGALHRLRGRRVLITFWQPWSAPCLAELRRLQTLHNLDRGGGPFILAFCGGAEDKGFADIRKELGLTFALVHDAEHRVARAFGIRVWPTTTTINAAGQIEHIGLGGEADYPKNLAR